MWQICLHSSTSGLYFMSQQWTPRFKDVEPQPHASVYVSVTLLFRLSDYLERSQMDKVICEQRQHGDPQCDAYCSEQLWKCQTGLRWEKCCKWDETADTSFPFIPSFEATFVAECFIYVCSAGPISRHLCLSPNINRKNQHILSRKRLLVSPFCRLGSMIFVWTCAVWISPNLLFTWGTEVNAVFPSFSRMSVLRLPSLLPLFFLPEM